MKIARILMATGSAAILALSAIAGAAETAPAPRPQVQAEPAAPHHVKPDVRAYLDRLKASPRPRLNREILAMIRQLPPERMVSTDDLPVGELATIKDVSAPGPGGDLRMRMYDARAQREPGPVVVFYHGGAYVVGSIETHAGLAAEIARQLDVPVISVEYRLAPENPWPAAVDDGEAAARWISANGAAFGRQFNGLVLSGDSAGGNLTLVTALALRDKPAAVPLIMQLPIYPATDHGKVSASRQLFSRGFGLDISPDDEDLYAADPKSVRASPILANLAGLPPTVLVTASLDPLRDEGRAFAAKLVEAGVPTVFYEAKGTIHGFATYRKAIPSAQENTEEFLALARTMLNQVAQEQASALRDPAN